MRFHAKINFTTFKLVRRYVSILTLLFLSSSVSSQVRYLIEGNIKGVPAPIIYLTYYTDENNFQKDTSQIVNGKFKFKGSVIRPVLASLSLDGNSNAEWFYIDSGVISIEIKVDTFHYIRDVVQNVSIESISGSQSEDAKRKMIVFYNQLKDKLLSQEQKSRILFNSQVAFVKKNPDHNLSSELLSQNDILSYRDARKIFQQLSVRQKQNAHQNGLLKSLQRLKVTDPGKYFYYGKQYDTANLPLNISKSNHRIMLVAFWASNCLPCREMHKKFHFLYSEYQSKGLEIVGISLDENRNNWIRATEVDKINWKNVSQTNGFMNSLVSYYSLEFIPFYLLLDKDNKILVRNPSYSFVESFLKKNL